MSNPFTAPSLSGYNSSPPSDDGSATDANTIKWATHIDKIGDPLRTYAQAISSNASTAFGKIFGNEFVEKTAAYTVATSDQGKVIVSTRTADNTITLPAAATAGANFCVAVLNASNWNLTVDAYSSETINGSTTLSLPYNLNGAILVCDGSSWYALETGLDAAFETDRVESTQVLGPNDTSYEEVMTVNLRPNKRYGFEISLTYVQNSSDLKFKLVFSQTPQDTGYALLAAADVSANNVFKNVDDVSGEVTITTLTDGENTTILYSGFFQSHATTGGTLQFQAGQNTSDSGSTSISAGHMRVIEAP